MSSAYNECWQKAAKRHGVLKPVLMAIADVESGHAVDAVRYNKNGSVDYGLMQINSRWLPYLKRWGVSREALKRPCVNIYVGAWILKQEVKRYGFNWRAIGAYHAGAYTAKNREEKIERYRTYARKVWRRIRRYRDGHSLSSARND